MNGTDGETDAEVHKEMNKTFSQWNLPEGSRRHTKLRREGAFKSMINPLSQTEADNTGDNGSSDEDGVEGSDSCSSPDSEAAESDGDLSTGICDENEAPVRNSTDEARAGKGGKKYPCCRFPN